MVSIPKSDRATYAPALQPDYANTVSSDPKTIRNGNLPADLVLSDFNFLSPGNALLTHAVALYSAGHNPEGSPPAIIQDRDRSTSTLIGDSGGYQIKKGTLKWRENRTRQAILDFLETHADYSMTLDHPPSDGKPDSKELRVCLDKTLENLRYFDRHRRGQTKWINVIQGRDINEMKSWIDEVKWYDSHGWAAGGNFTLNPADLLRLLILLRDNKLLEGREIFHQFGKGSIALACFYTEVQQAMRASGIDMAITFDTSSPFLMTGRYSNQYTTPVFTTRHFCVSTGRVFNRREYVGSTQRFPFNSAVGNRLSLGDICVRNEDFQDTTWDQLSHVMIKHHNLDAYLRCLEMAHNMSALHEGDAQNHCPEWILLARQAARRVFVDENPMTAITRLRSSLNKINAMDDICKEEGQDVSV